MDMYNYHADDLEEDEIDYELGIRGIVSDENMESKRRELRLLINDDRKNPKLYTTTVTLEQEAEWIAGRIRSIQDELKRKISLKAQSRLISLRNRVLRAPSSDALTKNTFVALIDAIGSTYFSANPNQNAVLSSVNQGPRISDYARAQPQSTTLNPRASPYHPNSLNQPEPQVARASPSNSFSVPVMTSSPGRNLRSLGNLDLPRDLPLIPPPASKISANLNFPGNLPMVETQVNQANANWNQIRDPLWSRSEINQATANLRSPKEPPVTTQQGSQPSALPGENRDMNVLTADLKNFIQQVVKDAVKDYVEEFANMPTPSFSSFRRNDRDHPITNDIGINTSGQQFNPPPSPSLLNNDQIQGSSRQGSQQMFPPNYFNNLRTKIEKWQVFFNGEVGPKSPSVSEFIRQVTILAKANHVSDAELLQQAYIFFTGDARRWYFTYWEKFVTWQHLVHYLTMTFENPNKDKAIEDEMRERKQRPNERFSAYLADMERLSQSLTRKMDPNLKFKLVFDNTKLSYRRRLALIPVRSINELAEYCYQFDALEPSLYAQTSNRSHPQTVHQVDLEELEDLKLEESDSEEINAINSGNKYANRNRFVKRDSKLSSAPVSASKPESSIEEDDNMVRCWNCKSTGHFAKACQQPRRVYCYACGEPNVSKATCPKNHLDQSNPKNEN